MTRKKRKYLNPNTYLGNIKKAFKVDIWKKKTFMCDK